MIVEMKHLTLLCVAREGVKALESLRDIGCVHLDLSAAASPEFAAAKGDGTADCHEGDISSDSTVAATLATPLLPSVSSRKAVDENTVPAAATVAKCHATQPIMSRESFISYFPPPADW